VQALAYHCNRPARHGPGAVSHCPGAANHYGAVDPPPARLTAATKRLITRVGGWLGDGAGRTTADESDEASEVHGRRVDALQGTAFLRYFDPPPSFGLTWALMDRHIFYFSFLL
jgi:hypothetical protein